MRASLQPTLISALVLSLFLAILAAACADGTTPPAEALPTDATQIAPEAGAPDGEPIVLTLASHDSFAVSEDVVAAFEDEHGVALRFLALGDAGAALNKMILSREAPLADVFFGVDNTFLSRALEADIFEPYASPLLDRIPDELELDAEHRLLPVDYGFVTINADRAWFAEHDLALPETLEDLADPAYRGLLVVQNPASSSPGLAFLLTTIGHFGPEGYLDYWGRLRTNDVLVTDGWSQAYFDHFTAGSGGTGERPLVVSYATSPPADVVYAEDGRTAPATVSIAPPGGHFRQIEFIGVARGTEQPELARALVDFMLGQTFQSDIPLQMFVYPADPAVELPEVFVEFAPLPLDPVAMDPAEIEASRETWIAAWTDVVLR